MTTSTHSHTLLTRVNEGLKEGCIWRTQLKPGRGKAAMYCHVHNCSYPPFSAARIESPVTVRQGPRSHCAPPLWCVVSSESKLGSFGEELSCSKLNKTDSPFSTFLPCSLQFPFPSLPTVVSTRETVKASVLAESLRVLPLHYQPSDSCLSLTKSVVNWRTNNPTLDNS